MNNGIDIKVPPRKPAYSIQVGAFLIESNAERLRKKLEETGYKPYVLKIVDYRGKEWFTVRIKDCATLEEAFEIQRQYLEKERKNALVTAIGSLNPIIPNH